MTKRPDPIDEWVRKNIKRKKFPYPERSAERTCIGQHVIADVSLSRFVDEPDARRARTTSRMYLVKILRAWEASKRQRRK